MTNNEIKRILDSHLKWLNGESDGKRADLSRADLREANLSGAKLSGADLSRANLSRADLFGADLSYADLSYAKLSGADILEANLCRADLHGAYLSGADLRCAKLSVANLSSANLYKADLSRANLYKTNLSGANLRGADLSRADLLEANLSGADLHNTNLEYIHYNDLTSFYALSCPEKGSFIGFKKCGKYIVELRITENAKRCSATSRKCRCSEAEVLSITNIDGTSADISSVSSNHDPNFIYKIGEIVRVDDFDENRWHECSAGIHFYITRDEAASTVLIDNSLI